MRNHHAGYLPLLILGLILAISWAAPSTLDPKPRTCGYKSCPKINKDVINVHVVPHSHDDVGWLKTVDQYFYGSNTGIQKAGVSDIIDSVVNELLRNPVRKFIQVETAFFAKWWKDQDESRRNDVKNLVQNGQLEFVGGAWSMNDEATTHYQSTVDQFAWGYRFLNDTFGACARPKVGWQIDPFGHSRSFATLLTQMGHDGVFLGRIDWEDKNNRLNLKTPEMVWKTSPDLGKKAQLLAGLLYNRYKSPPGFCFDEHCSDDPIIDDPSSPEYNVDNRVQDFTNYVKNQADHYPTNNIILTMGGDFQYQSATKWYKNLDKLIRHVNEKGVINAFYSTPSCYVQALNEANKKWTTKEDDFFPYGSDSHSYWTGYFTSRPTHKYMERHGNNFLQVSKQLASTANLKREDNDLLTPMREAMGVVQHHDALTGTEKQHVANDYARMLSQGLESSSIVADKALKQLTKAEATVPTFESCLFLNVSQCNISQTNTRFVVTVYNPLAQKENTYVRIPIQQGTYTVRDPDGNQLEVQTIPVPEATQNIAIPEIRPAPFELVFNAKELPPIGFRSYFIERTGDHTDDGTSQLITDFKIGFKTGANVEIDQQTGLLKKVSNNGNGLKVDQNFFFYEGYVGDNHNASSRASGAYVFRPDGEAKIINKINNVSVKMYKGPLVMEIHQTFSDWVSQVIRTYANEPYVEFVWQVGPIPVDGNKGKEIISRYDTGFKTEGVFYTDSNGRELIQRKRDFRPTWKVDLAEKVSGNYYPVTSRIALRDEKPFTAAVFVDRAEGGSSHNDGQIELMIHRRLLQDDNFGVGEALNEMAYNKGLVARGSHVLLTGESASGDNSTVMAQAERVLERRLHLKSWLFFSKADELTFDQWRAKYEMEFSGLSEPLPENVHLLTLEPWRDNTLLVRFEHYFDTSLDLGKPVKLNLQKVLKPFKVVKARETTLGGNEWLSESSRFEWQTDSNDIEEAVEVNKETYADDFSVTLNPMEIHTFIVEILP